MSHTDDVAARRRWAETWGRAGEALETLKRDELRALDTQVALAQLADAFEHAVRNATPTESSGLVEQQRYFALLRG